MLDMAEKCIKATGDPQYCAFLEQIGRRIDYFVKCVRRRSVSDCFDGCLKGCREENCEEICLHAMEAALGAMVAGNIIELVKMATSLTNVSPFVAVASIFDEELEKVREEECPEKEIKAMVLVTAAVELYKNHKKLSIPRRYARDLLLLTAPALAEAHRCVGEKIFEYLDSMRPFFGEKTTKRIATALKEGIVFIGNAPIFFKPIKTKK